MRQAVRELPTDAPRPRTVRSSLGLSLLISSLAIGMAVYVALTKEFTAMVLLVVLMIIVGLMTWLIVLLRKVEKQRDQALASSLDAERRASHLQFIHSTPSDLAVSNSQWQQLQELQREVATLRARELVLEKQAHYDELTKLPNRTLLRDRFRSATERSKRSNKPFAVVMVDLDGFKAVNDKHGHEVGDLVLVATANRILGAIRASDTVARLGGDEFVLVIESMNDAEEFAKVGKKLVEVLFEPISLTNGFSVSVGASLGMSIYPHDGSDLSGLLAVADQAMYQCKTTGMMSLY